MREIIYLVKRNVRLFVRDYGAVFFSVLSMLIVLALMVVFLGSMNSENLVDMLAEFGGERDTLADEKNASYLIQVWTLSGILLVNAVTVTLTVMGNMVEDEIKNRLASFYTAPISRIKISLGYIFSAWFIGVFMCMLTLVVGEIYMLLCNHPLLSPTDWLKLFLMVVLNVFVYACIAYLLALFVHSAGAWSGLLTVIGTLIGFVGAIYLPMSMLPKGVAKVLKCLPMLHGAAMMREVCTEDAIAKTFAGLPEMAGDVFREQMGICVIINGKEVSLWQQVCFLMFCGIMAAGLAFFITRRRRMKNC